MATSVRIAVLAWLVIAQVALCQLAGGHDLSPEATAAVALEAGAGLLIGGLLMEIAFAALRHHSDGDGGGRRVPDRALGALRTGVLFAGVLLVALWPLAIVALVWTGWYS